MTSAPIISPTIYFECFDYLIKIQSLYTTATFDTLFKSSNSLTQELNHVLNMYEPQIQIIEQPASTIRFRYETEGNTAGNLISECSTKENPRFPSVAIIGYRGNDDIIVQASLVTKNYPNAYKTHPHKLIGQNCANGVCQVNVNVNTMVATFPNVSIQCVKKKDMEASLKLRQRNQVDPYNQGFEHITQYNFIDSNCVRLCFQLLTKTDRRLLCPPVVSDEICHQRSVWPAPVIVKLSYTSAPATGGLEIILLSEKIDKTDIKIRFYQGQVGQNYEWEAHAEVVSIHKQVAIILKTPPYTGEWNKTNEPIKAFVHLYRPSNGKCSEPVKFEFTTPKKGIDYLTLPDYHQFRPTKTETATSPYYISPVSSAPLSPCSSSSYYEGDTSPFYNSFQSSFPRNIPSVTSSSSSTQPKYLSLPDNANTVPSSNSRSLSKSPDCSSLTLYDMDGVPLSESNDVHTIANTYCDDSNIQTQSKNDETFADDNEMQLNYRADLIGYQQLKKPKINDIDNLINECIQESKNLETSNDFYYFTVDKKN